jgi:hypothetical protein
MGQILMENGWLLDKDLQDSRVIDQNEVKLYKEKAIIAYLDVPSVKVPNPTPVENDEGKIIGQAHVFIYNQKLIADVLIDYSTPERLSAETRDGVRYWVRAVGMFEVEVDRLLDFGKPIVAAVQIKKLVLSTERPYDRRLLPFGDPIL